MGKTNKQLIKKQLSKNRPQVYKNLIGLGWKKCTLDSAFFRGEISKSLARDLEKVTSINIRFWLYPDHFDTAGVVRESMFTQTKIKEK